ncbi:hypothetical protein [Chryseobacterium hagamense]|uniref:Uncharacterized protein n=1 Tax=Chryseobacterium hagamense TaxID=395935 RepID=A0A511YKH0_9FLAO|nr:hypothetical protein [Chryseobacterium hagamense]GEN75699.1 hypothetical protein CHA01nite_14390 [Chryseobacterium hagamense]
MKNLILAAAFVAFGTITASAQTTPQKRMDTTRDTTRNNGNMGTGTMNNSNGMNTTNGTTNHDWDKSKTDTASWKNKDGMKTDRKMKKKNNR